MTCLPPVVLAASASKTAAVGKGDTIKVASIAEHPLSLAECITVALKHQPSLVSSRQARIGAEAHIDEARSAYLPSVNGQATAGRSDLVQLDSPVDPDARDIYAASLGLRYLLFDGGRRAAGLAGAKASLRGATSQYHTTLQETVLKVEESYYQLLAARELQQVAKETVHQAQYHVDIAKARHANGLVARSDVLRAETEKADAALSLVKAESQVRISRALLAAAMGFSPAATFSIKSLSADPGPKELEDVRALMTEAAAKRPELRSALAAIDSSRAAADQAVAGYWPQVSLAADYGVKDEEFVPDRDEWSLGVSFSWPIFDGFNREGRIRRTKAEAAGKAADYEALQRKVELEVWSSWSQLVEAGQAITAARALVASADESSRVSEGEYKSGMGAIVNMIDAQTARSAAHVRLVQTRLDWHTAMSRLERAVGRIDSGK